MRRGGGSRKKQDDEDMERLPRDFLVYRNGEESRPVNFTYVPSKMTTWDTLLESIEKIAPPIDKDDRIEYLYTPRGRKKNRIRDLDHLEGTITDQLVACGADGFIDIPDGYERLKDLPDSDAGGNGSDSDDDWRYGGGQSGGSRPNGTSRVDGYQKGHKKGKDLFIFLFQNGKGYRASPKVFYAPQLARGLDFLLDEIGRYNNKEVSGLHAMDGSEVSHLEDLRENGAYVIVYKGQKFDNSASYYLPDGAIDTSHGGRSSGDDDDDSPRERKGRRSKKSKSKSRSPSPKRRGSNSPKRRSSKSKRSNSRSKRR